MTNDLRIVPSVATPRMWSEMFRIIKEEGKDCQEAYHAALTAAPDYSHLVIVEREKVEELVKETQILIELSRRWYALLCRFQNIPNSPCEAAQDTENALTKIKDILND